MIVLSLHAAVLVIIVLALMQAGCTARSATAGSTAAAPSSSERLHIERIYDSPTGPDLYRLKGPHGTSYHRAGYQSPLRRERNDVAKCAERP